MECSFDQPVRPQNKFIGSKVLLADGAAVGEDQDEAIMCGRCDPEEEISEESRAPKISRRPGTPTKADIDAHLPWHAEFRSWCKYCVAGKAVSRQHSAGNPDEEALGVTVSVDYCFMIPEESEEEMDAILVGYDSEKMGLWTMSVDAKGPTLSAVGWLNNKIEDADYNGVGITIKSGQEESIKSLKKVVSIKRHAGTSMIESPVRVSKSNGKIERAISTFQAQFRTLRLQFEDRIKARLPKG